MEGTIMENRAVKVYSQFNSTLSIKVIPGHFATNHSHINYYIDMTTLKTRQSMALAAAKSMVHDYVNNTVIDTIVCMDGTEVIGAFLAEELSAAGFMSMNQHQTIYIVTPEFNSAGQMVFKDNLQSTIKNKHVLLLLATATTGRTVERSLDCIRYYGGIVEGISAIFSATESIEGYNINSIFKTTDIPEYHTYSSHSCPFCKAGNKIDAIVNSYGYSVI